MFDEYGDLLSVYEVCEILNVGKNRVYELLAEGALKGFRLGRVWKIPRLSVIEFITKSAGLRK